MQNAKPYANGKGKAQKGKGRGSTPSPGKGRGKGGKTKAHQRYGGSHQYHTPTTTRHASDTAVSVGTNSDSAPTEISALVRQPAQTTTVADRPTPNMVSNFGSLRDALRAVPDSEWLDHSACESDIRLHDGSEMLKNTPSSTMLQEPHNLVDKMLEGTPMEPLQDEYEPTEEPSPEHLKMLEEIFRVKIILSWRNLKPETLHELKMKPGEQVLLGEFQVCHRGGNGEMGYPFHFGITSVLVIGPNFANVRLKAPGLYRNDMLLLPAGVEKPRAFGLPGTS